MSSDIDSPAADAYRRLARRIVQWTPPTLDRVATAEHDGVPSLDEFARTEARSCA